MSGEQSHLENPPGLPSPGTIIGNCRLVALLGEGAIGVVYKGFDIDLEMERAVKILKPGAAEYIRHKFETEAKITARLEHPNIVKVISGGIWDGRLPFMQMEFVDGKSLRQLLQAHSTFHPAVCLSIVELIAAALAYAGEQSFSIWGNQGQKLVHRDLKPENIMISRSGILKVMDFGLAQLGNEPLQSGWGTPHYMSPEQHEHGVVDFRSDIFSLGVIFYEMVCGKRPFGETLETMLAAKGSGNYQPASFYNPSVLPQLSQIIDKCLQPDILKRFSSYDEFSRALISARSELADLSAQELLRQFSVDPGNFVLPVKTEVIQPKQPGRNRALIVTVSGLIVAIVIAGALLLHPRLPREQISEEITGNLRVAVDTRDSLAAPLPRRPHDSTELDSTVNQPVKQSQSSPKQQVSAPVPATASVAQIAQDREKTHNSGAGSALAEAQKFYREKKYTGVIAALGGLSMEQLPVATQDSARVMLAESYYHTRALQEIVDMSNATVVKDSRFCLIVSLTYEMLGDYHKSASFVDKAITVPSLLGIDSRDDLLYRRAKFYQRRFAHTATQSDRELMLDAWRLFLQEACTANNERCQEAANLVSEL